MIPYTPLGDVNGRPSVEHEGHRHGRDELDYSRGGKLSRHQPHQGRRHRRRGSAGRLGEGHRGHLLRADGRVRRHVPIHLFLGDVDEAGERHPIAVRQEAEVRPEDIVARVGGADVAHELPRWLGYRRGRGNQSHYYEESLTVLSVCCMSLYKSPRIPALSR